MILTRLFLFLILVVSLFIADVHAYRPPTAAMVVDARNGEVLYNENIDAPRHPASLVKKMTLYLIFDALKKGKIKLSTRYSVSRHANRQIPCKLGVPIGKSVTVDVIIKGLVTKSANDMAVVFAEGLHGNLEQFVRVMNEKAKELGMNRTLFTNASGVPDQRQITTARDMIILAQSLYNHFPEYWKYFQLRSFVHSGRVYHNHNHLMKSFPAMDGLKTGFTNASGFNLSTSAIRYTKTGESVRLFAVVMGGTSRFSRDDRMKKLLETHFKKLGAIYIQNPSSPQSAKQNNAVAPEAIETLFTQDDDDTSDITDRSTNTELSTNTQSNPIPVSLSKHTSDTSLNDYLDANFIKSEDNEDVLENFLTKDIQKTPTKKILSKQNKPSKKLCVKKSKKQRRSITAKPKKVTDRQENA